MDPDENDQQDQNDQNSDAGTEGNPPAGGGETGTTDDEGKPGDSGTDADGSNPLVEKWKRLSRKNENDLKAAREKLKEYETASMSESERLQQDRDSHKTRAEKAESSLQRWDIAAAAAPDHATLAQLRKVVKRMSGDDSDALEEDAKELWEDFAPAPKTQMPSKPKEKLRGGGDPDDEPEDLNPSKLAARIPRAR